MKISLGVILLVFAAGCTWGPRIAKLAPANGPRGDSVTVVLTGRRAPLRGELYAVDSIFLLVATPELRRVPWSSVTSLRAIGLKRSYNTYRMDPTPGTVAELATLSRFPQGLDPTQLAAVLAARHQAEVTPVE